jgi:hypothetical protein
MKVKIHICVKDHKISDEEYWGMDEVVEISDGSDEHIENEVDELLRYDYDLGHIYDNKLLKYKRLD